MEKKRLWGDDDRGVQDLAVQDLAVLSELQKLQNLLKKEQLD